MTSERGRAGGAILRCAAAAAVGAALASTAALPPGFPADAYDAPHTTSQPAEGVEVAALADAMPAVEWSACLALAAQAALHETRDAPDPRLPDGRLHTLTRLAGCTDPVPSLLVVDTSEASTADVVAELRRVDRGLDGPATHAGVARGAIERGRYQWRWVVILSARPAELAAAVPRILDPDRVVPLRVRLLDDGLTAPTAVIAHPDGPLLRLPLELDGDEWWTPVPTGSASGALTVQLFAESATGPRLVAVLDLAVGSPPFAGLSDDDETPTAGLRLDTVQAARTWMVSRVNSIRSAAGVGALTPDVVLDRVAAAHGEDMRGSGYVGHRSPTTGDLTDRLDAAGVAYRSARENVAWAAGVEAAMRQLERSPAHRANLVAPDVDRVGIGLVATPDGGDPARAWLVTQVLVGSVPRIAEADVLAAASDGVDASRERRGVPPAARCPELDAAAGTLADEPLAVTLDADACFVRLRDALGEHGERWGSLRLAVVRVSEPGEVRLPDLLGWDRAEAWGVAVRNLPHGELPPFQVVWVASADLPWRACD